MMFSLTSLTAFMGMAVSLWLATYLLARGYNSLIALRAVAIMLALAAYFMSAYFNLYDPVAAGSSWRAIFLSGGLAVWYDLVDWLVPGPKRQPRWNVLGVYLLAAITVVVLAAGQDLFSGADADVLATARVHLGLAYVWYGLFQVVVMAGTFYNFYRIRRAGSGPRYRYFVVGTAAAAVTVGGYFLRALQGGPAVPRLAQDLLILIAVCVFGYAVARHQAFVERQTTLNDFPILGLTLVGLAGVYAGLARARGLTPEEVALVAALAIITHSGVDLGREFLDRRMHRQEGDLREHLRRLARGADGEASLQQNLEGGLELLCQGLNAAGGFVALREEGQFKVLASLDSLPAGSLVQGALGDELFQPDPLLLPGVAWLAPALPADEQVAVVGLGLPRSARSIYSEAELDLLAEVADWVGLLVSAQRQAAAAQRQAEAAREQLAGLAREAQAVEMSAATAAESELEPQFVGEVETLLRQMSDYARLGESPLSAQLQLPGLTHVERGKAMRARLIGGIEALRPTGTRPREPLPREWHNYAVLYDAYVEDVPNREIMARLYISQGTFNRVRRKALRAVARNLVEM